MSLRDGARSVPSKQSPVTRGDIIPFGDCFATCARNDMQMALLRQCPTGMILHPANLRHVKQESLACQSAYQSRKPLGSGVDKRGGASLRQSQSATGEELRPLFFAAECFR